MSRTSGRRWPRVLAGTASCLVLTATLAAGLGGHYTTALLSKVKSSTDGNFVGLGAPEPGAPINILLMGSDSRSGKNAKGHGNAIAIAGARSDTTILLHISGDRTRALAVSIPRDSQVQLATCKAPSGSYVGGNVGMFNSAFDIGGPGCTAKTVQELTGVQINHYVVADFTGFKGVVQALDGVEVCLVNPVNDPLSKLDLPAGKSVVKGEQALAFVRARHNLGDGSDISRIDRQQEFLSSAARKATSAGVMTNPAQVYEILGAAASSLTTDPGLATADALMNLAIAVSDVSPSKITFATVPWKLEPDDIGITWVPSQAQQLWTAINSDTKWPPAITNGSDGNPLTAAPDAIDVKVVNGTDGSGVGASAAKLLTSEGYHISSVSSAKTKVAATTIEYNPKIESQVAAARSLAYATGSSLKETSNIGDTITFIVGPDLGTTLRPVTAMKAQTSAAAVAKPRTAAESICSR